MKNKNENKNLLYLIVIKVGIVFLKVIYFILKLLPTRKRIVFISRQSNTPTIDIITLKDYLEKKFGEEALKSIFYHEIIHWLRLMPYKIEKNEERSLLFYSGLIMVMSDVEKRFEK